MQDGWTALIWAAARGKCDVVTELISLGADVDIQDNVSHFFNVSSCHYHMVQDYSSPQFAILLKSICVHLNPEVPV